MRDGGTLLTPFTLLILTVTSHDFHQMIGLRCDGPFIDLEGKSGTQLSIYLLGCKYLSECIHYFDLEANYRLYS